MAIEDFGNSLLSAQESKNEKLYKKLRRDRRNDAKDYFVDSLKYRLAGTAVKGILDTALNIGNDMVRERTTEFFNSEDALAKRALISSTLNNVEQLNNEIENINKFQGGEAAYFLNQATNDVALGFDDFAIKQGNQYSKTQLDNYKTVLIKDRANQLRTAHNKVKNSVKSLADKGIKNIEDYDKLIAENSPQTISAYFADKVQKTFTGTDPLKNFFRTNKDIFDTAEENQAFFEVYENVTNDLDFADELAQHKVQYKKTTGKDFVFSKTPDITYDFKNKIETEISVESAVGGVFDKIKVTLIPEFHNGIPIRLVDSITKEAPEGNITSLNPMSPTKLRENFQNKKYVDRIAQVATFFNNINFKDMEVVESYVKLKTGKDLNVFAAIADTGKVDDIADMAFLNELYGTIGVTQKGLMDNFGLNFDTAASLSSSMHVHNIKLQKDRAKVKTKIGFNFLDEEFADNKNEIDVTKSALTSSFMAGGDTGGWNSMMAALALNHEYIKNANTGYGQFSGEEDLVDMVDEIAGMSDVNFLNDVSTMQFTTLVELASYIADLKSLYNSDERTSVKITKYKDVYNDNNKLILSRIERVIANRLNQLQENTATQFN